MSKSGDMARNLVDVYVGRRLKLRRSLIGMTQDRLGQAVGLTFQQIQKYEKGANRIGASRLYEFSHLLGVSPGYFFEGIGNQPGLRPPPGFAEPAAGPLPGSPAASLSGSSSGPQSVPSWDLVDPLLSRENVELLRAFDAIRNPALRRNVLDLVRSMASEHFSTEQPDSPAD